MRTRTNLHLENHALEEAAIYARARGISLGLAVSELILRGKQAPEPAASASPRLKTDAYGFLVVKATGPVITPETVREALEDTLEP